MEWLNLIGWRYQQHSFFCMLHKHRSVHSLDKPNCVCAWCLGCHNQTTMKFKKELACDTALRTVSDNGGSTFLSSPVCEKQV